MKNIFKNFSLEKLNKSIKSSFSRFTLSFISSFLVFLILEYLVYNQDIISKFTWEIILKAVLSLITVYFLSIWIYLLSEKFSFSKLKIYLIQVLAILFWVLFYFTFEQNLFNVLVLFAEDLVYIIITFIWVISFVFISSFIKNLMKKDFNNNKYYTFFNEISSKIVMSIIVWWFLTILWTIAISVVFELFDISSFIGSSKIYWYWVTFSLSLFTPVYFLNIVPENKDNTLLLDKIKENKFYNFLSNYIALPFIIIYFFILYAYTIKVLLNFSSWPNWIISWMVILFSLFWYLIYIFSYAFGEKSLLVRIFRNIFPFAVLFQTPMLFYAIYLRINQYDWTINRYLVVVFWIFLILNSIYFIFSKIKYLLFIPLLLTIFIIIVSIWPWWVYSFPENRQLELLKPDLREAGILRNWKIFKDSQIVLPKDYTDIDAKLSWKIYDKITYLCSYHSCDSMKDLLWKTLEDIKNEDRFEYGIEHKGDEAKKYTWIDSWTYQSKLIEKLKVRDYNSWILENQKYINFQQNYKIQASSLIKISNYDYLINLEWISDINNTSKELYSIQLDSDSKKLILYNSWKILEEFNLWEDFKKIYNENIWFITNNWIVEIKEPLILEKNWKKVKLKIILTNFSIKNPVYNWTESFTNIYINWKVLLKEIKN